MLQMGYMIANGVTVVGVVLGMAAGVALIMVAAGVALIMAVVGAVPGVVVAVVAGEVGVDLMATLTTKKKTC